MLDSRPRVVLAVEGMSAFVCVACGRAEQSSRLPPPCVCGVEGSWLDEHGSGVSALAGRRPRRRAVRASDLATEARERLATGDAALDGVLGGGFAFGQCVLVWGAPGAGKSRLTSRWASREPALYVSLEMPLDLARDAAVSAGADPARLFLLDTDDGWRDEAERLGVRLVVFDSATEANDPLATIAELSRWAYSTRGIAFAICQRNSRGRAFGGPRSEHKADTTLSVTPRRKSEARVRVLKSRFCPRGSAVVSLVG